jgi:hypothetical protein
LRARPVINMARLESGGRIADLSALAERPITVIMAAAMVRR